MTAFNLAFIDIETTGLKPDWALASILEIHISITNTKLEELAIFHRYIRPLSRSPSAKTPDMPVAPWDAICEPGALAMHTKSGLLERCDSEGFPREDVIEDAVAFLAAHNEGDRKKLMLAGNSIASLDLPFLKAFMPQVLDEVHYRTIDVSGFRNAALVAFGKDHAFPKQLAHTASADVVESINEMKFIANGIYSDIWERAMTQFMDQVIEWAKENDIPPPALAFQADLPFPEIAQKSITSL